MRIIREALVASNLLSAIRDAFDTPLAAEILTAEFFSSDDFEGRGIAEPRASEPAKIQHSEEHKVLRASVDSKAQIDDEIERIRKKCGIKYYVDVDNVVVKGHYKSKFDDYEFEDEVDQERSRHVKVDEEDESRQILIDRVNIKRNKEFRAGLDSDSGSQFDYEYIIGDSAAPITKVQRTRLADVVKV